MAAYRPGPGQAQRRYGLACSSNIIAIARPVGIINPAGLPLDSPLPAEATDRADSAVQGRACLVTRQPCNRGKLL